MPRAEKPVWREERNPKAEPVSQKDTAGPGTSVIWFQECVSFRSQKKMILSSPTKGKIVYDRNTAGGRALQSINLAEMNIEDERNARTKYNGGKAHIPDANNTGSLREHLLIPAGFDAWQHDLSDRKRKNPVSIRVTSSREFIELLEPQGLMERDWKREREWKKGVSFNLNLYP